MGVMCAWRFLETLFETTTASEESKGRFSVFKFACETNASLKITAVESMQLRR